MEDTLNKVESEEATVSNDSEDSKFKTLRATIKSKFQTVGAWFKDRYKAVKSHDPKAVFGKVKNWFNKEPDFSSLKNCGFGAMLAYRSAEFLTKIKKKFTKKMDSDKESTSKLAKILLKIGKALCIVAGVAFAVVVCYYAVKLFPAVICALAEVMAIALIVEIVFTVLQVATGVKTNN